MWRPDLKITDFIKQRGFTLSAEVIPPRNGAEQIKVLEQIKTLIDAGAQFLSVTKGAGGSLRGGSLPIAQAVKERFSVPCIAHFTCRDLSIHDVENQLMDHHYFGIRNILALRGDPPDGQPHWKPKDDGYTFAYQLIEQIVKLNRGEYLPRTSGPDPGKQEATDFCIGAAVYPEHPDPLERVEFFKRKVDAGADYAITDMIFDAEAFARFLEDCARAGLRGIPILPGTRVLKSKEQASRMMAKFKVKVPESVFNKLPSEQGGGISSVDPRFGLEECLKLVDKLKGYGASGAHIYVIADTKGGKLALESMKKLYG